MRTRRTFLVATSALTLAVAEAGTVVTAGAAAPYDFPAITARLAQPFAHRQVFSTRRLADGAIAGFMLNSLNAYQFDYGEGPGTVHALGIWYGTAVAMLLDDEAWRTYKLDLVQQRRADPVKLGAPDAGNPYVRATSSLATAALRSDAHGLYHDASLTALAMRGASFLACDNALTGLALDIAVTYGTSELTAGAVHADLRRRLLPGTLLVPAGVAAINQAQEAHFTLLPASV